MSEGSIARGCITHVSLLPIAVWQKCKSWEVVPNEYSRYSHGEDELRTASSADRPRVTEQMVLGEKATPDITTMRQTMKEWKSFFHLFGFLFVVEECCHHAMVR